MLGLSVGIVGTAGSKTMIYEPKDPAPFLGMELALGDSSKYHLTVSEACIQKVGAKFAEVANIETLLKKRITLPKLGGFLDAMERGYAQAYDGAENHLALKGEIAQMKKMALQTVLEEALGEHVSKLDRLSRRFLGIV
jgi:RNA-directed DNA polymerase